jgi:hypothetical protein
MNFKHVGRGIEGVCVAVNGLRLGLTAFVNQRGKSFLSSRPAHRD